MTQVNIHEAKTHLSSLINRALAGEEIVIAKAGKPLVELTVRQAEPDRIFGFAHGEFELPDSFYEPWSEEEIDLWYK